MFFQLHKNNYDTTKALQALVKCPAMKTIEKKWSDEDSVSLILNLSNLFTEHFKLYQLHAYP